MPIRGPTIDINNCYNVLYVVEDLFGGFGTEGREAKDKLIQNHSQGPEVDEIRIARGIQDFNGHIVWTAYDRVNFASSASIVGLRKSPSRRPTTKQDIVAPLLM